MSDPKELSIAEIRRYMLENGCKVTNHALVKHFKRFLTKPQTQEEARKQFKTYVNILATIKNENNQKYLVLRKKYIEDCPSEELVRNALAADATPSSPGGYSVTSEASGTSSPFRQPPPYKPPPEVSTPLNNKQTPSFPTVHELDNSDTSAMKDEIENNNSIQKSISNEIINVPLMKGENVQVNKQNNLNGEKLKKQISRSDSNEEANNKENISRFSFSSGSSTTSGESSKDSKDEKESTPNTISVKEATRKFNRMASEEEAKIISPPIKKKPEKPLQEKEQQEVNFNHEKAKEWVVAMSKANYQELHSLANDYPELVKLKDPATGNALHWAAKHGDADVIKLIAGTHKLDVNSRTNGGYTPLHLAIQFGRENICDLLWNTYKANRDLMDYSGNKPMDYNRQRTSVSDSTCSKIIARRKHAAEKDLGFLRIGSLNVRVKKTTEAFSNFLDPKKSSQRLRAHVHNGTMPNPSHHHHHHPHLRHYHTKVMTETLPIRASVPVKTDLIKFDVLHKSWGSADNIPQNNNDDLNKMPPPRSQSNNSKKRTKSSKRSSLASDSTSDSISTSTSSSNLNEGYSSMPTTPNQYRAVIGLQHNHLSNLEDSDSDSACGFNSTWRENGESILKNNNYSPVP